MQPGFQQAGQADRIDETRRDETSGPATLGKRRRPFQGRNRPVKNASRRRPKVEPLESLMLLSTLVAGPHQAVRMTMLPARSAQVSLPDKVETTAHPARATITFDRSLPPGQSIKPSAASTRVVVTPGHISRPATAGVTPRPLVLTSIRPGPAIAGHARVKVNTLHAMIVPANSRPVVIATQVTSTAPATSRLAKAEALFAAEHPALGSYRT